MMRPTARLFAHGALTAATVLVMATPAAAQGTLGALGFGYPVNGMSTRASGTAGAFGEFDALTPNNPAALGGVQRTVLSAQAEPEFRTLSLGDVREKTTSQRIPLLMLLLPARGGFAASLSARGFLDRSYSTVTTGSAVVDGRTLPTRERLQMRGAIGDMRAALGWQRGRLRLGLAGHIFTGEHVAERQRTFADTLAFGSTLDSSRATYFGTALSTGAEVRVAKGLAATLSYRMGNDFEARIRDTTRATGSVPARLGAALRYEGVPGAVFAVGFEQVKWSDMQAMSSSRTTAHDALNLHAGAEVLGPRLRGSPVMLRAGYARNELPFSTGAERVKETRFAAGIGVPIARDAASLDFSLQRANRSLAGSGAKEAAWLLGVGVQIRP